MDSAFHYDPGVRGLAARRANNWLDIGGPFPICSKWGSTTLLIGRTGYCGSTVSGCRNHCRMVFLDKLVLRVISRIESFSRKCIRLILASMPTVITPNSPAQSLSRSFNHMGQFWVKTIALSGSVLGDRQHLVP